MTISFDESEQGLVGNPDPRLARIARGSGSTEFIIACVYQGREAVLALYEDSIQVVSARFNRFPFRKARYAHTSLSRTSPVSVLLAGRYELRVELTFASEAIADWAIQTVQSRQPINETGVPVSAPTGVPASAPTTPPTAITHSLGRELAARAKRLHAAAMWLTGLAFLNLIGSVIAGFAIASHTEQSCGADLQQSFDCTTIHPWVAPGVIIGVGSALLSVVWFAAGAAASTFAARCQYELARDSYMGSGPR